MVFIPACGKLRAYLHGESLCGCTMLLNHGPVAILAARASALEQENARLTKCLAVLKQLDDDEIARCEQEGQAGTCSVGEASSPVGALPTAGWCTPNSSCCSKLLASRRDVTLGPMRLAKRARTT